MLLPFSASKSVPVVTFSSLSTRPVSVPSSNTEKQSSVSASRSKVIVYVFVPSSLVSSLRSDQSLTQLPLTDTVVFSEITNGSSSTSESGIGSQSNHTSQIVFDTQMPTSTMSLIKAKFKKYKMEYRMGGNK